MIKRENKEVFTGVRKAAKKCGCSPCHMSLVLNKKRTPGAQLVKRMRKLGIAI